MNTLHAACGSCGNVMYSYQQVLKLDVHKNGKLAVTETPEFYIIPMNAVLSLMLCTIFSKQRTLIIYFFGRRDCTYEKD